jgi:hypothetical protein
MTNMIVQEVFNAQFVDEKSEITPAGIRYGFLLSVILHTSYSVPLLAGWGVVIISFVVPVWIGYEIISYLISIASTFKDPFEGL